MPKLSCLCIALAATWLGCAPTTSTHAREVSNRRLYEISSQELGTVNARMLYEAVAELRPNFLHANARGESPTVFINGALSGGTAVLRDLPTAQVQTVHYSRGLEATQRHGSMQSGAVIEVVLRAK